MSRRSMARRSLTLSAVAALVVGGTTLFMQTSAAADSAVDCTGLVHISHRGAAGLAPENTKASMALADGATQFEVDVQLTSDGHPVLMHDTNLARTTDVASVFPGREADLINTFTLAELQQLDAGSWFDSRWSGEEVPVLNDALDYASPTGSGIVVELKDPALNPGLIEAIDEVMATDSRWDDLIAAGKVTFSSFDADELKTAQQLRPDVPVLWVSSLVPDDTVLADAATWADGFGTHYRTLETGDIDRIEGLGLTSMLYTMNSVEALRFAVTEGADAVITDFPNVLDATCTGTDPFPAANGIEISSVLADPPGSDIQPENGEYLVLTNTTDATVDVSGYYVNDAVINKLRVGDGYSIPPGGELRVYTGPGTNTDTRYYNGGTSNVLNNNGDSLALHDANHTLLDIYAY
ncbi:glycerophosphoryl diester phosphodiesterase [Stackebrandtia endophytica]|uniref:Glycerophosphoryl diester phosphodiesterase n=1 Tax=Stackebrandtia endophytica TaxID=1496996 RepID=A0A543B1Y5_9ACTN|nr:glycerophosphodiester phosphodiesterase family protein [Stackebrandtia endophytica]TQL78837.1 glycerophosphoryl diester phosphodiesterase [Stackebrandtia endophytica]